MDFIRRNRVLVASALCLLVAAALVVGTGRQPTRSDRLGGVFLEIMAPFQRTVTSARRAVTGTWDGLFALIAARDENVALRAHVRQLEQEHDRHEEIALENVRLRRLLDFRETLRGDVLTARVIGRDATGLARTLVIDRGEGDGITKGAAVLAPEGIIGQVFLASAHASRVLLISDHNSGVDALVQRTRARGIVQGTAEGGCGLKYVKRTEDVQVGDTVVTSGLDGVFPKGVPIGHIVAVDKQGQGLFQYAEVAPRVDFGQLEELLVSRGPFAAPDVPPAP